MATTEQLIEQARLRADMEAVANEFYVDRDEVLLYLNDAKYELDSMLLEHRLMQRDELVQTINPALVNPYNLPLNYFSTVDVHFKTTTGDTWKPLLARDTLGKEGKGVPQSYRIANNQFSFFPYRELDDDIRVEHRYLANFPSLVITGTADGVTTVDEVNYPNNWHSFLTIRAAIAMLAKEETSNNELNKMLVQFNLRIKNEAAQQNLKESHVIRKVDSRTGWEPYNQFYPMKGDRGLY